MLQRVLRSGRLVRALAQSDFRGALLHARHARAAGDWPAVTKHCLGALRVEPGWSAIWVQLAQAQERQYDYAAAEASYLRALAIDYRRPDLHLQLARVLEMQRRFQAAATSCFDAARLDPRSPARRKLVALGYRLPVIDEALKAGSLPPSPLLGCIEAADRAFAAGDYRSAASRLEEAVRAAPDCLAIWVQLGHVQKQQGDLAAAESSYRCALELDESVADTHLQLGHALKLQCRLADAAASYFRAAQLDTRSPAREELLAFGYRKSRLDAALRAGTPLPTPPLRSVEAADRARADGDWPGAALHFAEALRADPQWAAMWVQLGHAQKEQGDFAAAEASYRRALEIDPEMADTHLQLGHVLKLQRRFGEAATSYFCTVRLGPAAREGLYARGELIAVGYRSAAVEAALETGSLPWPPAGQSAMLPAEQPILSIIGAHLPPVKEEGHALPTVLRHRVRLPEGEIGMLIDVQMVTSLSMPAIEPSVVGATGEIPIRAVANRHGPNVLTFRLQAPAETDAEFVLRADLPPDCVIRRIEIGAPENAQVWPVPHRSPGPLDLPTDQIRNFIIGTTGICNASCPHCPTNKLVPSSQWASAMSLDLFHNLIDQIVKSRIFITGHISLGLFGDGLLDRHVVERASRLRAAFPHAPLHVNTNAAAYSRRRHAVLGSIVDIMAVHVETLDEQKYATLMEPLRLENVLPKINQIIEDMASVVSVASPMHKANIDDLDQVRAYFAERGVQNTIFTPISNRCSRDEIFQKMAFGPKSGTCPEEIIFDLIVDWDGTVLVCCNDFLRQEPDRQP